jgi:hypothetical protein
LASYEPLAGRTVAIDGRITLTDASGTFLFDGVAPVYDLTVVEQGGTAATVYHGLRRRDPLLVHRTSKRYPAGTLRAELHGRLTGGGPYPLDGDDAFVYFLAPGVAEHVDLIAPYMSGRGPDWTMRPTWMTSDSISGTVYAMRANRMPPANANGVDGSATDAPVKWWFGQQPVTMRNGRTTSADVTLVPASSIRFSAHVKSPPGHDPVLGCGYRLASAGVQLIDEFGGCGRRKGSQRYAPDTWWDCEVEALPIAGASLCVWDDNGADTVLATTHCDVENGAMLSMVLQPAPTWTEPADLAVWNKGMHFAWTPFDHGVYRLELSVGTPTPQTPSLDVYTPETTASWPDLSPLGVAFPDGSAEYRVDIVGLGPYASIDEATAAAGLGAIAPKESRASISEERRLIVPPRPVDAGPFCDFPYMTALVCDRRQWPNEVYMLAAINNHLRHYPEFAAAIGLSCVKDCAAARAYAKAYAEYARQHPGFDFNEPADEPRAPVSPAGSAPHGHGPRP